MPANEPDIDHAFRTLAAAVKLKDQSIKVATSRISVKARKAMAAIYKGARLAEQLQTSR
jgi:hypothetical protein